MKKDILTDDIILSDVKYYLRNYYTGHRKSIYFYDYMHFKYYDVFYKTNIPETVENTPSIGVIITGLILASAIMIRQDYHALLAKVILYTVILATVFYPIIKLIFKFRSINSLTMDDLFVTTGNAASTLSYLDPKSRDFNVVQRTHGSSCEWMPLRLRCIYTWSNHKTNFSGFLHTVFPDDTLIIVSHRQTGAVIMVYNTRCFEYPDSDNKHNDTPFTLLEKNKAVINNDIILSDAKAYLKHHKDAARISRRLKRRQTVETVTIIAVIALLIFFAKIYALISLAAIPMLGVAFFFIKDRMLERDRHISAKTFTTNDILIESKKLLKMQSNIESVTPKRPFWLGFLKNSTDIYAVSFIFDDCQWCVHDDNYKWSKTHRMTDRTVEQSSETGDEFYVVKHRKTGSVLAAYNKKYFEYSHQKI